jgi:hypothetical protein
MTAPPPAPVAHPALDLRLFVRCHAHLLAFDASWIERILLVEEAPPIVPPPTLGFGFGLPRACLGVLSVSGRSWAAWDLGLLLGLAPVRAAYLLLRSPHDSGARRLALRSDRCLHVGPPAAQVLDLPPGLGRARPGVVSGAFPVDFLKLGKKDSLPVGLHVSLARLWDDDELAMAGDLVEIAEQRRKEGGGDGAA